MQVLKAFIVEDERHNRDYLMSLLEEHCHGKVTVVGFAPSVLETIEFLKHSKVDLLFLDIELSDGQVFDLLNRISYRDYRLVFITGYSEHAIRAIKFSAVDYLLKPIVTSELIEAVDRVMQGYLEDNPVLNDLISRKQFDLADYLIINNQHAIEKIAFSHITHFEADGVYTIIHHNRKKTVSSKPIGVYEDVLSPRLFNRCHKSYIINRTHIRRVGKGRSMEVILSDGTALPVAVRKREEFSQWFIT
jgi:two-component system LytT family response regulator